MSDWIEITTKGKRRRMAYQRGESQHPINVIPIENRYIMRKSDILIVRRYHAKGQKTTSTIITLKYPIYSKTEIVIKGDCYKELNNFLTVPTSEDFPLVHQIEVDVRR